MIGTCRCLSFGVTVIVCFSITPSRSIVTSPVAYRWPISLKDLNYQRAMNYCSIGTWDIDTYDHPEFWIGEAAANKGGTIDFIQSVLLEEKGKYEDHWRLGPKRHELTFDFKTDRGIDGINFEVSPEAKVIRFNLHIDGKHINELSAGGRDLPFDQQKPFADKRQISRECGF